MAVWPTTTELKQRLDLTNDDWDEPHMERLVAQAVAWVKQQVGDWVEGFDSPDEALAQSALERAVEIATNGPTAPATSKSKSLLYGHRKRFGIA